ncbi:MAG: hypothetical protein EAX95_11630 [Candidatus Thorarchaeota archaeon]|nr:hypothetical protein [Candidatus Thorarchaeota archaeon]
MTKMRAASYKIPGGKLIKIRVESEEDMIRTVIIMGDFFLHPEESLAGLEEALRGARLELTSLTGRIESYLEANNVTVIGASAADFARAILMAI